MVPVQFDPNVRFYWFDGKAPQGPFAIEDLIAKPGFNSESMVCPVGSERSSDWKPAVNYEPLRDALFKPKPALLGSPPCSSCGRQNPDNALFCSGCGRKVREAEPPRPPSLPEPAKEPVRPVAPQPPLQPLPSAQTGVAPLAGPRESPGLVPIRPLEISAGPKRVPSPGKMGRIAEVQEQQRISLPPQAPRPVVPLESPKPAPHQDSGASSLRNKPLLLALIAFCAAFAVLALIFVWSRPGHRKAAAPAVNLPPPPIVKLGLQEGNPTPAVETQAAPAPAPAPIVKAEEPKTFPRRRHKRAAAVTPPASETAPVAAPPASPPRPVGDDAGVLSLPGLPKKIRRPIPSPEPSGAAVAPAEAAAPATTEQLPLQGAKDQFDFCHQLKRQGAFSDFYDTCLCAPTREAAPYKGGRRRFVDKSSQDPASEMGSAFEISEAHADGESVLITAKWSKAEGTTERTEKWGVENGAWCLKR